MKMPENEMNNVFIKISPILKIGFLGIWYIG